jgi:hypothetical protein
MKYLESEIEKNVGESTFSAAEVLCLRINCGCVSGRPKQISVKLRNKSLNSLFCAAILLEVEVESITEVQYTRESDSRLAAIHCNVNVASAFRQFLL